MKGFTQGANQTERAAVQRANQTTTAIAELAISLNPNHLSLGM
jgi:hypothetical protein